MPNALVEGCRRYRSHPHSAVTGVRGLLRPVNSASSVQDLYTPSLLDELRVALAGARVGVAVERRKQAR